MAHWFLYLFDPLCGWCYGASSGITMLASRPGVSVQALPAGLFAGNGARTLAGGMADHILASDRRIAAVTGAVFGEAYRTRVVGTGAFRLDSGPATLALTAVAQSEPGRELEVIGTIQRARYVDGRDITDHAVLGALLRDAGLSAAARAFEASTEALLDADQERIDRARTLMQCFGLGGVPGLLRDEGGALTPVDVGVLYQDPLALLRTVAEEQRTARSQAAFP